MVTAAEIENDLLKRFYSADTSEEASITDRLLEEIVEHFQVYKAIVEEKRQTWYLNIDRLKSIYAWGYNIGLLVQIFDENIGEYMKVARTLFDFQKDLEEYYTTTEKKLKAANVDPDYKHVPEELRVLMKELIRLHTLPEKQSEMDFQGKYEKYNFSYDLEKAHLIFRKNMLQYKEVEYTAVFYTYALGMLIMFHHGLQQGIRNGSEERKELMMKTELVRIGAIWGRVFHEFNELID